MQAVVGKLLGLMDGGSDSRLVLSDSSYLERNQYLLSETNSNIVCFSPGLWGLQIKQLIAPTPHPITPNIYMCWLTD